MEEDLSKTKLSLITAAGELFAERGFEGTSIRAIANKAQTNIAAINYHFGTKDNLYTETLHYVVTRWNEEGADVIPPNGVQPDTPQAMAETIYSIVRARFTTYLSPDRPRWYGRLALRSLLETSHVFREAVERTFEPEHKALKQLMIRAKPGLSKQQAEVLAFSLVGQIAFYIFAREAVLMLLKRKAYDRQFIELAAGEVARVMISALGLPEPPNLTQHSAASTDDRKERPEKS